MDIWKIWADNVSGAATTGGHFQPEGRPHKVIAALSHSSRRAIPAAETMAVDDSFAPSTRSMREALGIPNSGRWFPAQEEKYRGYSHAQHTVRTR